MTRKELRYAFTTVIRAAEKIKCSGLHHEPKHRHESDQICLAEYRLNRQIHVLKEYLAEQGFKINTN